MLGPKDMTKTTIHQKYGRDVQKRSEKYGRNYDREGLCASRSVTFT